MTDKPVSDPTRKPEEALALVREGEKLFEQERPAEAIDHFLRATRLDPKCDEAWNDLGVAAFAVGDAKSSLQAFDIALMLVPGRRDSVLSKAKVLIHQGRRGEAAVLARDLLERDEKDADARALVGELGLEESARPKALFAAGTASEDFERLRLSFAEAGWQPTVLQSEVGEALSVHFTDRAALARRILLCARPRLLVLAAGAPLAVQLRAEAARLGLPVWLVGAFAGSLAKNERGDVRADDAATAARDLPALRFPEDGAPFLSVIAPTYDRQRVVLNLLDRLALQDLEPGLFEVVLVDDGSPKPLSAYLGPAARRPYSLTVMRQENAGPAKARNTAIRRARGEWLLIFNDDTVPPEENLRRHLVGQARSPKPMSILGSFDPLEAYLEDPFIAMMTSGRSLFPYKDLQPGAMHGGGCFWTCNLSVPKHCVEKVGLFDETYKHAICEDTELGFRLERDLGLGILYDPTLRAWHDHKLTIRNFRTRTYRLGYYEYRQAQTYKLPGMCLLPVDAEPKRWMEVRDRSEREARRSERIFGILEKVDRLPADPTARAAALDEMEKFLWTAQWSVYARGQVIAAAGLSEESGRAAPHLSGKTTSAILVHRESPTRLKAALECLRSAGGPLELVVLALRKDALGWLRSQAGVTVIEADPGAGASRAFNDALRKATGDTLLFCSDDQLLPPSWREVLLAHLESWPDIGIVGPLGDTAALAGQRHEFPAAFTPDELATPAEFGPFAQAFRQSHQGNHAYPLALDAYCFLLRKEVVDRIGGFDEQLATAQLAVDDLCLRARLASFLPRVAGDLFSHGLPPDESAVREKADPASAEAFRAKWGFAGAAEDRAAEKLLAGRTFDRQRHFVALR